MIPYTSRVTVELEGGAFTSVAVPAPARGTITSLIVLQTDGDLDGFALDCYSRLGACENEDDPDGMDSEIYRLIPTQTVAPLSAKLSLLNQSVAYVNADDIETTSAIRNSAVYLDIAPTYEGEDPPTRTFQISLTVTAPEI